MSLSVSDAIRLLPVRVPAEKAPLFAFESAAELVAELNAEN
jgi:hypothetical protein